MICKICRIKQMNIMMPMTELFTGSSLRAAILQKLFIERANHFCSWIFTAIHGGYSDTKSEKRGHRRCI